MKLFRPQLENKKNEYSKTFNCFSPFLNSKRGRVGGGLEAEEGKY
jgi:hypothetical protein